MTATMMDNPTKAEARPDNLVEELADATTEAMGEVGTTFAESRADKAKFRAPRAELAEIQKGFKSADEEQVALQKKVAALIARQHDAERILMGEIHVERMLALSIPSRLQTALDAAQRRTAELKRLIDSLRECIEGARRNERESRIDADRRSHPNDAAHAAPFAARANAAAMRAAEYQTRRDEAQRELGELLRAIDAADRAIRS